MEANDDSLDIQAQVLQTTLQEITATRRASGASDKDGDGGNDEVAAADDCCVVCLDSVSEPCIAMPCGHSHFDFVCLVSWLQEHPNCPLCKAAIYKVRYVDSTSNDENFYRVPNAPRPRNKDVENGGRAGNPALSNLLRQRRNNDQRRRRDRDATTIHTTPTPGEAIERRRHIYRHQLYSLHVGSNRISGYKPTPIPEQFATTPHLITRARLWIRRELQVFAFLSSPEPAAGSSASSSASERELTRRRNNAEFLLEYIIAILKTVDIQGSAGQAEDMLADFLGRDHARLFLHELRSWLRSPAHSLVAWDKEVKYPDPLSARETNRKRKAQEALDDIEDGEEGDGMRRHPYGPGLEEGSQTPKWPERDNRHRQTGHDRIRRLKGDFDRTPVSRQDGHSEESDRQGPG